MPEANQAPKFDAAEQLRITEEVATVAALQKFETEGVEIKHIAKPCVHFPGLKYLRNSQTIQVTLRWSEESRRYETVKPDRAKKLIETAHKAVSAIWN